MSAIPPSTVLVFFALLTAIFSTAHSHGTILTPRPRGSLSGRSFYMPSVIDPTAPTDWKPHFPAGNRSQTPGAGIRSQIFAAGPAGWTPFNPLQRGFRWRAGVCGDQKHLVQHHMKNGEFYHGGKISATYQQGGIVDVVMKINAHHNGYIELHVCDVSKCPGGEISESCFASGDCHALQRTPNPNCDSGTSRDCAPIDRNYPTRWYLPCSKSPGNDFTTETFAAHAIKYSLPDGLACEHCVMQWFWTAANTCNPPGVLEYFRGPDRPRTWGTCPGQGGARGGVAWNKGPCGGTNFPEEYLQCADVRIVPSNGLVLPSSSPIPLAPTPSTPAVVTPRPPVVTLTPPVVTPTPPGGGRASAGGGAGSRGGAGTSWKRPFGRYNATYARSNGFGAVRDIVLVCDGLRIVSLADVHQIDVSRFQTVSIEAVTQRGTRKVNFFIDGGLVFRERTPRFYIAGKWSRRKARAWKDVTLNRWFTVTVEADGDRDSLRVFLRKA